MMSSNMAYHDETSSLMSSWQHIGVHGDMTMLGSPETHRSGSPGSQASQSPIILSGESTPFGENPSYSKNSAYPESLSSSSCSISMATSSTPDSGSDMCSLVDEEFLKHYRVREIMDSLQHSGNYTTAQSAMLAASAYYDYYDPYSGPGSMNDVGYHGSPDIKMGIEELCPICGDKVSGYHYGLQTCESCKGFFKRTVQNKKVYSCVDNRNCMIDKTQRKRCPYCRFQKCISVGMKLEAVRADRMRGGRNKFGPMYKRDRALKQQAVRQRQQMFAQMQYQMQFNVNGLAGPGMPPGMMDGFGPMCPPDIKPNIAMLGLHPPPTNGSPPGPMGPAGNMMGHPYHRPMLPMNSHHDGHLSPNSHHLPPPPTSLHSSHPGSYLPHGPPPPHHNSQYHPHPHMMSSMNSQHGPPFGHQGPSHGSNSVSGASGMPPPHHPPHSLLNLSDMSSSSSSHTDTNSHGGAPPNTQHTTSGGPLVNSQHHHGGNNHQGNHNSGDIVSMATGVPSIPSPGPNSGVPQLIQDMQKNEPDPFEVRQKLSQIAEMMLQQQGASLLQDTAGVLADGTCEINKPMLQLVCRVCDQALFLLVEWARGAFFFRDLRFAILCASTLGLHLYTERENKNYGTKIMARRIILVEDQMKLLQNCWSELLIFDFVFKQMAHSKHRHLLLGTGHMVSIDTLDSVGLSDVKERLVDLAAKFRDLKLDHNEFTCLKFLILLNPDVVGLVNRPQVEDYQKKVNMVLLDYTSNFYPAIHDKFGQLLVRLPEIRLFSLRAEDYLYFQHISGNIPENTLLMEMLHSKRK